MNLAFSLFEATISLYTADAFGAPVLGSPVWLGACVEGLSIRDNWLNRDTRPTGRAFPKRRPLVPQFEISLARLWVVPVANPNGYQPTRQPHVMDIVWRDQEEGTAVWRRETYYGVTIVERARESKDFDARDGAAFLERQVFLAESVVVANGIGTPPALSASTTYRIAYQSAAELLDLYSYDPNTELFTALASTTGRATLTYVPTDRSDKFEIAFGGGPVVELDAAGNLEAALFVAGVPTAADLPRLNFYVGPQRVASVTAAGIVYANQFIEAVPSGSGVYLYGGGSRRAVMTLAALTAVNFVETLPSTTTADTTLFTADTTLVTADRA